MKPPSVAHGLHLQNAALNRQAIEDDLHRPGHAPARRNSVDAGEVEPQRLQREIESLERQVATLQVKDDSELHAGSLSDQIQGQVSGQRRYEKIAMADFYGSPAWARLRRRQLANIPGGEVPSMQYGASFAKDRSPAPHFARLNIDNKANGVYQRMVQSDTTVNFMHQLFQAKHPAQARQERVFVNSEQAAAQLLKRYQIAHPTRGALEVKPVLPGLFALTCKSNEDWKAANDLIEFLGCGLLTIW